MKQFLDEDDMLKHALGRTLRLRTGYLEAIETWLPYLPMQPWYWPKVTAWTIDRSDEEERVVISHCVHYRTLK